MKEPIKRSRKLLLIPESKCYVYRIRCLKFPICRPPASVSDRRQKIGSKLQWYFRTTQLLRWCSLKSWGNKSVLNLCLEHDGFRSVSVLLSHLFKCTLLVITQMKLFCCLFRKNGQAPKSLCYC